MIDRLVRGLASGSELSAEEILDVLWLASVHPTPQADMDTPPADTGFFSAEPLSLDGQPGSSGLRTPAEVTTEAPVGLQLESKSRSSSEPGVPAKEVNLGAPGLLRDVLALPWALRRFRRVRAPGQERQIDVEQTVAATAEAGRLIPVFTSKPERGLDLVLVADGSPSMRIWADTFDEFARLAAQSGAFRSVSRWTLVTRGSKAQIEDPVTGTLQSPQRLVDPSGRRVVLIATDASHEWWYTPAPWDAMAIWAAAMPTALVQVLPPHYWAATAVGDAYITTRARRPGGANGEYSLRFAWWADDPGGVPLPVVELTPEAVDTWTQAAVNGTTWASGITATPPDLEYAPFLVDNLGPNALVNGFLSRASAGAERLARVLATARHLPLSLIAVLQEALAPGTGVTELAEIMAGGLLEHTESGAFRFRAGTRELLRRGATAFDEWAAYDATSRYLEDRQHADGRLRALVQDPSGSTAVDTKDAPFAELQQTLATRLGLRSLPTSHEASERLGPPPQEMENVTGRADVVARRPVDLVCAIDLADLTGRAEERIGLARDLIALLDAEYRGEQSLRVGLVTCIDHSFGRRSGRREEDPVASVFPLRSAGDALEYLSGVSGWPVLYPPRAPVEDLLHEASRLLADSRRDGRIPVLLTLASRLPHPPEQRPGGPHPCPRRYRWQILTDNLARAGVRCAVVADDLPSETRPSSQAQREEQDCWRRIGPEARYPLAEATVRHVAKSLRLLSPVGQATPFPLPDEDQGVRPSVRSMPARPSTITETPHPPAEPPRAQRRIGLWGAPASGKTTFLSALFIAVSRSSSQLRVRGNNDESTDFLMYNTRTLNADYRFPAATQARAPLSWTLTMPVPNQARKRFRRGPETVPFDFGVELWDAPGSAFATDGDDIPEYDIAELADYMTGCQGLLLFIDPVRERERGDTHHYFHGPLLRIAQRVASSGPLPHHVAVCMTKFDDPLIFETAERNGLLSWSEDDPLRLPRVHDDDAEDFMREMLTSATSTTAEPVHELLARFFHPERVKYFATSAIGFYVGPDGEFHQDDPWNVVPGERNQTRIRSMIHPINVAEPLLWLGRQIAANDRLFGGPKLRVPNVPT